ncbi:MAG TPA: TetR/AcrR family transcriptional regulator [Streptosporangiaceae bacterium]|nr:TetR/AcrR family transcriptional regulator [Streptosporangiaceae bacterium]
MTRNDTVGRTRESPARRRVLTTARALFYAEGVRRVGIDRIIAEADVAKATFYHHFPTKDALVCAYLEEQSKSERTLTQRIDAAQTEPTTKIRALFDIIGEVGCGPGFNGCPFINAAAEYPDPRHPVRRVIAEHRRWFRGFLYDLLVAAGHPDAHRTAAMLLVLRDGLVVGSDLDDPAEIRRLTQSAVERILGPSDADHGGESSRAALRP